MTTIKEIAGPRSRPAAFVLRSPRPGDLGWVVQRNGALYAQEYGWDASYEALVARIVADYAGRADPREAGWIAELDGAPAGCVFCMRKDDRTAQLRLLLVEPAARGMGLGERLAAECLAFARQAGYPRDRPVDQRRTLRGAPHLSAARLRAGGFGAASQLRPRPGRAELAAEPGLTRGPAAARAGRQPGRSPGTTRPVS